ncbi:MAG TPA: XrtA system polysaccharide deacetylase [Thiobacillaceae bacterium]|nr:XrtA system polysaccharide deacetylase [Thiobacillaceae bacterium]
MASIRNAMTIDVEDYFQVSAFAPHISRQEWDSLPCRVERNVDLILALLDDAGAKATFFTLGWIAERHPNIVRIIVDNGHELASHGYGHQRASDLTPEEFRLDVVRAKHILEDAAGLEVKGYRAPSFSISGRNRWALDVLSETGHAYSSSIYPVRHDHYGAPDAPRHPYRPNGQYGILELPPTTVPLFGRNLPAAGGGYFRLMPYGLSRWLLRQVNLREHAPCMFYFHPWEVDPEQPRPAGLNAKTRFRHYVNLHHMRGKLERLLKDFPWGRVDEIFLNPQPQH